MDNSWKNFFDGECLEAIEELVDSSTSPNLVQSISLGDKELQIKETQVKVDEPNEMLLLPLENYSTREELLNRVRRIAFDQGYAIVIRKSRNDKYAIIGCDRGGSYRDKGIPLEQRKRKTASRLINCPFEISAKKKNGFWIVEIKNLMHNHEASIDMCGHPSSRRFSEEELSRIQEMSLAGIHPRQILSSLRQSNPNLQAISRTVYNAKIKIMKKSLMGRTLLEALVQELGEGGFTYNIEYNEEGNLTHLLFAHPHSIALTRSYPNVFVMDCTYKTNKYKMPLLDIIGVSSFNKSFYSCFVFLEKEEVSDYIWALKMFKKLLGDDNASLVILTDREMALMKAISVVFPSAVNLLCVWHIEKNILTNCRDYVKEEDWATFMSSWISLINSPSELEFNQGWNDFALEYKESVHVLKYITSMWLPLKEHFVCAWTDKVAHFGNRVTSRAEGAHAVLKSYLQVSTGNLREVKQKVCLAIENQYQEYKSQLSSEKVRVTHTYRIPLLSELVTKVSIFALDKLFKQYELAKGGTLSSPCKGHFFKTMGLPCAHMIRRMTSEKLKLNDIHNQWRLDKRSSFSNEARVGNEEEQMEIIFKALKRKYQTLPLSQKEEAQRQLSQFIKSPVLPMILEPKIQPHKGRPLGSKKRKETNSTKRDPSAFELMENGRKCGTCGVTGHNSRTCQSDVGQSQTVTISIPSMFNPS